MKIHIPFADATKINPGEYRIQFVAHNTGEVWEVADRGHQIEKCLEPVIPEPTYKIEPKFFSVTVAVIVSAAILASWIFQSVRKK